MYEKEIYLEGHARTRTFSVYEKEIYLEGHARTFSVYGIDLDLGFMVCNSVSFQSSAD